VEASTQAIFAALILYQWPKNGTHLLNGKILEELKSIIELIPGCEDHPPLFIFWDLDNVESFRNKIATYAGNLPVPFPVPATLTRNNLTLAVVNS
jgi:hypothetical protein